MRVVEAEKIWEFDVDDTLILWNLSEYSGLGDTNITVVGPKGLPVLLTPHSKNINLLKKVSMVGWYVRVHSGSGAKWAKAVVEALGLQEYVDEVCAKPLGRTDDRAPGDGLAYSAYRDPKSGTEV